MRAFTMAIATLGLAACVGDESALSRGVGFQDYDTYLKNRQAALVQPLSQGAASVPPTFPSAPPAAAPGGFSTAAAAAAIANAQSGGAGPYGTINPLAPRSLQEQAAALGGGQMTPAFPAQTPLAAAPAQPRIIGQTQLAAPPAPAISANELAAVRPRGNAPLGISETVSEMAVVGGVSDEQDFAAVSSRETIESDRERLARNRAQYQIDQPAALPQRTGVGPSIVEFALLTQHPVGVKLYRRSPLRLKKLDVVCAPYANDDLAQEAFLAAGGPERDKMGMDPDGDGYACGWDPSPYRAVVP